MADQTVEEVGDLLAELRAARRSSWASDSASPCVIWTPRGRGASASASCRGCRGRTAPCPPRPSPSPAAGRPGDRGPAIDEVAEEDRLAPVGVRSWRRSRASSRLLVAERVEQLHQLVAAAVDVADDVERPVLVRRLFQSGWRSIVDGVDLLLRCPGRRRAGSPRRLRLPQRAAQLLRAAGGRRGGRSRGRARSRLRSWQSCSGRLRTMATGRQWYSRASSTSGLRASGCTFVASTTVSVPRREPLARR